MAIYPEDDKIVKFTLPNGNFLDLFADVVKTFSRYRQLKLDDCEAGGLLLGYENTATGNYTIAIATEPGYYDVRLRCFFKRTDNHHLIMINDKNPCRGYMGTWHSHPQAKPYPSSIDFKDWKDSLIVNRKKTRYLIFMIIGTAEYSIWVGDCIKMVIAQLSEVK